MVVVVSVVVSAVEGEEEQEEEEQVEGSQRPGRGLSMRPTRASGNRAQPRRDMVKVPAAVSAGRHAGQGLLAEKEKKGPWRVAT